MTQVEAIKAEIEYLEGKPWAEEELARLYLELEKTAELEETPPTKAETHPSSKEPRNYTKSAELERERIRAGLAKMRQTAKVESMRSETEEENGKT